MPKKIPLRMCIVCRTMQDKRDLLRIVRTKQNEFFVDPSLKANGRGAYICKTDACIEKCKKSRVLNKVFKCQVDEHIYEALKAQI